MVNKEINKKINKKIIDILKNKVCLSIGCTEPAAVGLAVATAYRDIIGDLIGIDLRISPNIYKNGLRVGIPGTNQRGIVFASALAIACGDPDLKLELFKNVNNDYIEESYKILEKNIISIKIEDKEDIFFIEAIVRTNNGVSCCRIRNSHTNVVYLESNGIIKINKEKNLLPSIKQTDNRLSLEGLKILDLIEFAEQVPINEIIFLKEGSTINMNIANEGLKLKNKVGYGLNNLISNDLLKEDLAYQVRILTTAACDARMSGINLPVMSSAGSGNHGLTAIIPPTIVCNYLGKSDEALVRALAISHLITIYIKEFTGHLSPVCGCSISAGIGASAAIVWLLGGGYEEICKAINNMIGTLSGMICDGAKGGCAYKLSIASSEAIIQAYLAMNGISISPHDGIIAESIEDTIKNLGLVSNEGMKSIDNTILDIMIN